MFCFYCFVLQSYQKVFNRAFIVAPSCFEGKRDPREISVLLREFNQIEKTVLHVDEIFFHPNWLSNQNDRETNSAIVITKTKIPFNFFIYTTCFREFLVQKKVQILKVLNDNSCERTENVPKKHKFFDIPFSESKSGVLYTQFKDQWFLFGFYSDDIIESKVCEAKHFKSFADVSHIFECVKLSATTVSGVTSKSFCPEEIIFEENFDSLDTGKWKHENTLRGGGNWEFQWYVPDPVNSFVKDGILHIRPTFTNDAFPEFPNFIKKKIAIISPALCTDFDDWGCTRNSRYAMINPIRSASISTKKLFAFKYRTVEIRAKIAAGDWLASTISLLPMDSGFYGTWPFTGEIDLLESRGNKNYTLNGDNIGVEKIGSSFQFGAGWEVAHSEVNNSVGFDKEFHVYKLIWTPDEMKTFVDHRLIYHIDTKGKEGLWKKFKIGDPEKNPWKSGNSNAPFDKEFFISISLKVGGTKFFPDDAENFPHPKPWVNNGGHAATAFWDMREFWNTTWKENDNEFQIDYVKVTSL